jgi:hypothetical protein
VETDGLLLGIVGIIGVFVGSISSALIAEWRTRKAETRAERKEEKASDRVRRLEAIRQTRLRTRDTVDRLKRSAVSGGAFGKDRPIFEQADDTLIGDAEAIREYREILVELQNAFGKGMTNAQSLRANRVVAKVSATLQAQEERVRADLEPRLVPTDVAAELFDSDTFSSRLLSLDSPPSMAGRTNRGLVDLIRAWQRWRRPGG